MLRASKPRILPEGETLTPARLMLETLGIYEIFGTSLFSILVRKTRSLRDTQDVSRREKRQP